MKPLVALLPLILLAGCSPISPPPSRDLTALCSRSPNSSFTTNIPQQNVVLVRQCDDRAHDYLVPRGWILQVVLTELRSGTSSDTWMDPVSSSPSVLHVIGTQRVDDAGSSRYVVTTFRPAAPGKATIWSDSRNCARTILLQTSCSTGFRFEIHVDVI